MSWKGVPFVNEEDFHGYPWTDDWFWNQFVEAAEMRINSLRAVNLQAPVVLSRFEKGVNVQSATQINNLRRFGNYHYRRTPIPTRNEAYAEVGASPLASFLWVDSRDIAVGTTFDPQVGDSVAWPEELVYFSGGLATAKLLARMNEILDDVGCPTIPSDPIANGVCMGIPFTRLYGPGETPTVAHGPAQDGDWVGPHIWNELWALLEALDTLTTDGGFEHWVIEPITKKDRQNYGWSVYEDVVTDSCGHLSGSPTSSSVEVETGLPFEAVQSVRRNLWDVGHELVTTLGFSLAEKATIQLATPNLDYGDEFYIVAVDGGAWFGGSVYLDLLGAGGPNKISHVVSGPDNGGTLTLEVGSTGNHMPAIAATCVNPVGDGSEEHFSQALFTGFGAIRFVYPQPVVS